MVRVGKGHERGLNQKFVELKSWYLFDSRFCNVAKGNEKGHVENLVKRSQRTFLTPLPEVTSLEELNAKLEADCRRELERTTQDGVSYQTLWDEERQHLLPLPADPFPACVERSTRIDKHSLVHFDGRCAALSVGWKSTARASALPSTGVGSTISVMSSIPGIICRFWSENRDFWIRPDRFATIRSDRSSPCFDESWSTAMKKTARGSISTCCYC